MISDIFIFSHIFACANRSRGVWRGVELQDQDFAIFLTQKALWRQAGSLGQGLEPADAFLPSRTFRKSCESSFVHSRLLTFPFYHYAFHYDVGVLKFQF